MANGQVCYVEDCNRINPNNSQGLWNTNNSNNHRQEEWEGERTNNRNCRGEEKNRTFFNGLFVAVCANERQQRTRRFAPNQKKGLLAQRVQLDRVERELAN